jgi:hypothetical protein
MTDDNSDGLLYKRTETVHRLDIWNANCVFFYSGTVHPALSSFLFIQLNAQLDYSTLKLNIKIFIKMLLHISVNKRSSGSLLPCFAKVMISKIKNKNTLLWNQFGRVAAYAATRPNWFHNDVL